jgi:hypothetical protein
MTTDDLARQGIEALRAGDKTRARQLLEEVVEANPNHQIALLWLATAVDDTSERRQYLERAVSVNPNNDAGQRAAMGLAQIESEHSPADTTRVVSPHHDAPPPARPDPEPPQEPSEPQSFFGVPSSSPSGSHASEQQQPSPFNVPSSDQPSQFKSSVPDPAGSSGAGSQPTFTPPPASSSPPPPGKSSSNTKLIIGIVSAVILIPCICVAGVFGGLALFGSQVDEADFEEIFEDLDNGSSGLGLPSTFQGSLDMGDEVTGELDSLMEADDWTFEGEEGQRVTIRCEAARGEDTDPRINLLDPDGDMITNDDDSGSGYNALIEDYRLPDDGTYTIKVDVFTEGEYVLSLEEE